MKHDKILPKKHVDPQKGVVLLRIPPSPTICLKERVNLYLLHYEAMLTIPMLQHMNLQLQITLKP